MPTPTPEEFWKLLAASQLIPADTSDRLRRGYAHEIPAGSPASDPVAATTALAKWLVQRGTVTKWQARRLLAGESGPFFVADYRLLERLENDGPGRLFRARHEPSGRGLCLLVLDRRLCQRVDVWTEVVRRTTIAHDCVDPMLSRTWALEQSQGNRFIVCEDVEGVSLADELAQVGPFQPADACRLMLPVFAAVAELHRRGAVHGGLSLDALRREPPAAGQPPRGGRLRLLQMPLVGDPHAVPTQPPIDATERISRLGRRASFVAPELMLPGRSSDRRSDVYALGCMLHALLTGMPPCWQGDAQRTLSQAAFVGPPPLGPPQVPVAVATLVSYLVAREPENRYPDAAEAADALAGCLGLPPVSGTLPVVQESSAVSPQPVGPAAMRPPASATATAAAAASGPVPAVAAAASPVDAPAGVARQQASRLRMIGWAGVGGLVALAAGMALAWRQPAPAPAPPSVEAEEQEEEKAGAEIRVPEPKRPKANDGGPTAARQQLKQPSDDGDALRGPRVKIVDSPSLPWASPTMGQPPTLAFLPPGSQLVLLARPAEIVAAEDGRQFVRSLGPRVAASIELLGRLCGCGLEGITAVQAGWQAGGGESGQDAGAVLGGWAVWLAERSSLADDAEARERAWGTTVVEDVDGETLHVGPQIGYWLPSAAAGRVLVMAPPPLLRATVKAALDAGVPAAGESLAASLPLDMQSLVGMLDDTRHVTVLGSPHYLLADGRPLMAGPLARLVEPLGLFFGGGVQAAALSLHFGDAFYAEVDAIASRAEPAKPLSLRLTQQIETLADAVEDYCATLNPHPYGRKLVIRLPAMIRALAANARCGAEGTGVVLNAYLPRHAGHNLVLASELALEQSPGAGLPKVATTKPSAAADGPTSGLQKKISLVFAKDTLEKSIQMLSEEIGVPMEILGGDLQLEGITKNQSFSLDERDKPAEAVLRTILAKSDSAGRLVYVFRTRDGVESIEITTKAAATKRGDPLPQ